MKLKLVCLIAASTALISVVHPLPLQAQAMTITNTANSTTSLNPQTFFNSVGNYFTTSNPNLPIRGSGEIALGLAYQSGVNFGSDFDARYKLGIATNSGVLLESVTRNAGVAGVIVSEEAGLGYYLNPASTPDVELSAGLLAGYRFDIERAAFTAYADARKSLTPNTFAGLRLGYEYDGSITPSSPVVTVYTGFTF